MTSPTPPVPAGAKRTTLPDGTVCLSAERCSFYFRRVRPGALLLRVEGFDSGSLGDAPLDELTAEMTRYPPLELFIDASEVRGVAGPVSELWTAWLNSNRSRLSRVTVLVNDRFVTQTMAVAKLFSRTGELLQILSDRQRFEQALAKATTPSGH